MATASNAIVRLGLESNSYEKGLKQAQKQWQDFTRALGLNIGKITAVGAAVGAVTGALKVAKDAFFKNEQQLDEWGRTVKSAESLYTGFLNALNNGNISGYLQNINSIVSAARQAYDALDELGTFNAFNQVNQERARTAFTEAIADFREGTGSKEGVQAAAEALKNELRERQTREQGAYEAAVKNVAAQRGISGDVLLRIMQSDYATLQQYKNLGLSGSKTVWQGNGQFGGTSTYQVATAATEQEAVGEALRQLNDTEIQALQAMGAQAQRTATEMANLDKQVSRVLRGGSTTSGGGSVKTTAEKETYIPLAGSIDAQVQKVKELQDAFNAAATDGLKMKLLPQLQEAQKVLDGMRAERIAIGLDVEQPDMTETSRSINEQVQLVNNLKAAFNAAGSDGIRMGLLPQLKEAEQTLERMKNQADMWIDPNSIALPSVGLSKVATPTIDNSDLEKSKALAAIAEKNRQEWIAAANAISEVGSALQGIEDPAAKVVGIIGQAVATIALSFAQAMKVAAETTGPWGWLAFAATGTATMISTIAAIKQATAGSFAEGGVIKGNHYSNDMMLARVNAGETILTASQTGTLAARLQGDSLANNMHLTATISGEQIRLALNNYGRRTGRGEYITTNFHQ